MDVVSPHTRSRMMSGIKGKNTKPELLIRKALFRRGFRYRLHGRNIPGQPDLVLKKYNAVIFINGCFWHCHDCHLFKWPKTSTEFWKQKLDSNRLRDKRNHKQLEESGLRFLIVWECALKGRQKQPLDKIVDRIQSWLNSQSPSGSIEGLKQDN